ncbi:hypothetical protein EYF80_059703 [Liparis tanakae]|uniref:Uncharacterized protein n=1 Tax=Liparis tanakae TaxID=230148 RepID=A0A4Z2EN23_9TELE|nr:hypothetical protein EYF80_059703 [Liparis tanakae]
MPASAHRAPSAVTYSWKSPGSTPETPARPSHDITSMPCFSFSPLCQLMPSLSRAVSSILSSFVPSILSSFVPSIASSYVPSIASSFILSSFVLHPLLFRSLHHILFEAPRLQHVSRYSSPSAGRVTGTGPPGLSRLNR